MSIDRRSECVSLTPTFASSQALLTVMFRRCLLHLLHLLIPADRSIQKPRTEPAHDHISISCNVSLGAYRLVNVVKSVKAVRLEARCQAELSPTGPRNQLRSFLLVPRVSVRAATQHEGTEPNNISMFLQSTVYVRLWIGNFAIRFGTTRAEMFRNGRIEQSTPTAPTYTTDVASCHLMCDTCKTQGFSNGECRGNAASHCGVTRSVTDQEAVKRSSLHRFRSASLSSMSLGHICSLRMGHTFTSSRPRSV